MARADEEHALVIWNLIRLYGGDMTDFYGDEPIPAEIKNFLKRKPSMHERQRALVELLASIIRDDYARFRKIFDKSTGTTKTNK